MWSPLQYVDLASLYMSAPGLWDALILLTIFLGLSQYVFTKKDSFGKRHGKTLAIGVSLALTFATALWQARTGVYIGSSELSILPLTIIFLIFYFLLYKVLEDILGMPQMCALSLAYIITYSGVNAMFGYPSEVFRSTQPLLQAFIDVLLFIAIISLVMCMVRHINWSTGSSSGNGTSASNGAGGGGSGGGDNDDADESQTQPADTSDLQESITYFKRLVDMYAMQCQEFRKHADRILKARSINRSAGDHPQGLVDAAGEIDDVSAKIRSYANAINRHKHLTQLPAEVLGTYLDSWTRYYAISTRLETYWNDFQTHYRARKGPEGIAQ